MNTAIKAIIVIAILVIALGFSFGATALLYYGICWAFGWTFTWKFAFGIWLGIRLINMAFNKKTNRK